MKGRSAGACLLILSLAACDREASDRTTTNLAPAGVIHTDVAPIAGATYEPQSQPRRKDPGCWADREGEYSTIGNRWERDANICVDRVALSFVAFPGEPISYMISSGRCPDQENFARSRLPKKLFEMPVPKQIRVLKKAITHDLRAFARLCGIRIDPAPFVDQRFNRFYVDYGDGWWFYRRDGGFDLRPHMPKPRGDDPISR